MIEVKHNKNTYTIKWNHRRDQVRPETHCVIFDRSGLLSHGKGVCGDDDCFDKNRGRKESLKRAIQQGIPRTQLALREKIWNAYKKMPKKARW